jgi:muramoyltetrapeptide carboxypeptidase LdcA involved in peptidoglycan recycling
MRMLLDPRIRAIAPPWGGETAIDLLPHLDFDAIAGAEPTWFIGSSDISALLTPLTLLTGIATSHGSNLMDTPHDVPAALVSWMDVAALPTGTSFRQSSPSVHRVHDPDDWTRRVPLGRWTSGVVRSGAAVKRCQIWPAFSTALGRFFSAAPERRTRPR